MEEYYIGTTDLRGVLGDRKNGPWIRESTKKMPYNFTAADALVFRAIVALISRVYYGPSIEWVESNIGRYKRIKRWEFTSSRASEAMCAKWINARVYYANCAYIILRT